MPSDPHLIPVCRPVLRSKQTETFILAETRLFQLLLHTWWILYLCFGRTLWMCILAKDLEISFIPTRAIWTPLACCEHF